MSSNTNSGLSSAEVLGAMTVAAALGAAAATTLLSSQSSGKKNVRVPIDKDAKDYPEEIKDEMQSRVKTFFGEEGIAKLNSSFIVVVGLGGVGSHCAHMLVRSGIKKIRLIDFDQVTLSSLNRHAVATMADVGLSKADTLCRRLKEIVPWCEIEPVAEMFRLQDAGRLLAGSPTYVLDCIDDVATKAELIAYCKQNGLEVLTSMGAGGKSDPTRMRISALSDCINDPLASKIKWKLKKHGVAAEDVMSIFSIEKPVVDLLPLNEEQKAAPENFGNVDYMRVRVIPVLGTSPSIFGQAMASYVLCNIGGKMYAPEALERLSKNLKHKLRQVFKTNELERFGTESFAINIDEEDVEFVVAQVWRSRCAITNKKFGGHLIMTMTRWDETKLPTPDNLVLLMQDKARLLHEKGRAPGAAFTADEVRRIESRLAWAREACRDAYDASALERLVEPDRIGAPKLSTGSSSSSGPSSGETAANGLCGTVPVSWGGCMAREYVVGLVSGVLLAVAATYARGRRQ